MVCDITFEKKVTWDMAISLIRHESFLKFDRATYIILKIDMRHQDPSSGAPNLNFVDRP